MDIVEIPISQIEAAEWNSNEMNDSERRRLVASMERFELVLPVVVRKLAPRRYETIGGAQRLAVMQERGSSHVPCVVVQADAASARLISQALNHIHGHENEGLRAAQFREILESFSEEEVIELLPESLASLHETLSFGAEELGRYIEDWDRRQSARLHHRTFQLTDSQARIVDQAIEFAAALPGMSVNHRIEDQQPNPNQSGNALYLICGDYLTKKGLPIDARYRGSGQ
jgi:ParB family chromosome partitioning protein